MASSATAVILAFPFAAALVAGPQVRSARFQNRDAWTIEGQRLRVTILQSGGHVGEIVLKDADALNPLWIQSRPTIDADHYDSAKHERFYGGGSSARLMSGLLGHNLCFPYWGNPSPSEAAAGMTFHGEAGVVRWRQLPSAPDTLILAADMPESKTRITRSVKVSGQTALFDETAENLGGWDRAVGWCEHVTLGPPFLEREVTITNASLTKGRNGDVEFVWPEGQAEKRIDLQKVRHTRGGFVNNFLVDPARQYGYFAAFHPKFKLLFGYVFARADFPWLNIWEANNPEMLTRGMEFSNTPVHGTAKALYKTQELFGTATFEWLNGRGKLHKRYRTFSVRVPETFKGVADVRVKSDGLEIVEQGTGRGMIVAFEAE